MNTYIFKSLLNMKQTLFKINVDRNQFRSKFEPSLTLLPTERCLVCKKSQKGKGV